ncbi:ribosome silencing factor [Pseudactinotalea sp. HY160]|uniref:ribosome silencing factor n=1 Tax=Pseudactinotalea sp. HY160 TaxID=2654490 RepID=UPI00131059DD|nr:ribosome silencing factor [Pseudactinotalea sp. HY160]
MPADERARELAVRAAQAAAAKKGEGIVALDVADRLVLTDVFVIVGAESERQVRAVVDAVDEEMHLAGARAVRKEGTNEARWVLMDYGDIIVHVQHAEDREFYALERLWKDCPVVELPDLSGIAAAADDPVGQREEA